MLSGVARRLKRGMDKGEQPFDVFNDCQDHVTATARAHIEREIGDAFDRAEALVDGFGIPDAVLTAPLGITR